MSEVTSVVDAIVAPRPRAVPGLRGAMYIVRALSIRSRRNWRGTLIVGVATPVFFLAALGMGLGSLIRGGLGDVPYQVFLAPGLLAAAAAQYAMSEGAEPVLAGFKWQRTYFATVSTPMTPGQLVLGQLIWIGIRVGLTSFLFFGTMFAFGVVGTPVAVVAVPIATFGALALAAPMMAYSASIRDGSAFGVVTVLVVVPMTLAAGTFFPVSELPDLVRVVAWITPLWHTVSLCRDVSLDTVRWAPFAGHLLYLASWLALGAALAVRRFRARLIS